jgi:hypothetical protein
MRAPVAHKTIEDEEVFGEGQADALIADDNGFLIRPAFGCFVEDTADCLVK